MADFGTSKQMNLWNSWAVFPDQKKPKHSTRKGCAGVSHRHAVTDEANQVRIIED